MSKTQTSSSIRPENISTCVLGEHGSSSCIIWSWSRILGLTLDEFINKDLPEHLKLGRDKLLEMNQRAGFDIYEKKGSTSYGVASAAAKIADAIIYDTNELLPVSVFADGEYGISGVALSLPCLVNKNGAYPIGAGQMTDAEKEALQKSAAIIKEATGDFLSDIG